MFDNLFHIKHINFTVATKHPFPLRFPLKHERCFHTFICNSTRIRNKIAFIRFPSICIIIWLKTDELTQDTSL